MLLASQTDANSATLHGKLSFNPIDDSSDITLLGRESGVLVLPWFLVAVSIRPRAVRCHVTMNPPKCRLGASRGAERMHPLQDRRRSGG